MKLVIQRVSSARVLHERHVRLEIQTGMLIFVGVEPTDTRASAEALGKRVASLRIFEDVQGGTTLTIKDVKGEFLVLPQPTLCADLSQAIPNEVLANASGDAKEVLDWFCIGLSSARPAKCGFLGLSMKLQVNNEGPASYLLQG